MREASAPAAPQAEPRETPPSSGGSPTPPPRWSGSPVVAGAIRLAVVTVPLLACFVVVRIVGTSLGSPSGGITTVLWWMGTLGAGLGAAMLVDRIARRFLPLATLLRLTLLFPDRAPSRYKVWRSSGTEDELRRRIEHGDDLGATAVDVLALVARLDRHDRSTRGHSERVRLFVELIGEQLHLSDEDRDRLRWGALLHDVGKLDVDHGILNKPGKPTAEEWERLRSHPHAGLAYIGALRAWLGPWSMAVAHHHERHDGGGYPEGLAGDEISLAGRITSVADAFEVMTANRSYQKAKGAVAARADLVENAGTQFDPRIVRAFLDVSLPRLRVALGPSALLSQVPVVGMLLRVSERAQVGTLAVIAGTLGAASIALSSVPPSATPDPGDRAVVGAPGTTGRGTTGTGGGSDGSTAGSGPNGPSATGTGGPSTTQPTTGGPFGGGSDGATVGGTDGGTDAGTDGGAGGAPGPDLVASRTGVDAAGQAVDVGVGLTDESAPFIEVTPHTTENTAFLAGTEVTVVGAGLRAGLGANGPYIDIITPFAAPEVVTRGGHQP